MTGLEVLGARFMRVFCRFGLHMYEDYERAGLTMVYTCPWCGRAKVRSLL